MFWKLFSKTEQKPATKLEEMITSTPALAKLPVRKKEPGKECKYCHTVKPAGDFNKSQKASDGLQPYCRSCQSKYGKKHAKKAKKLEQKAIEVSQKLPTIAICVRGIPRETHERVMRLAERKKCTFREVYLDMIKTYLILNDK